MMTFVILCYKEKRRSKKMAPIYSDQFYCHEVSFNLNFNMQNNILKALVFVTVLCNVLGSAIEGLPKPVDKSTQLTSTQRKQLEEFRSSVSKLLEDDYERSDEYLLGYLQSKKWRSFPAKQMLKIAKNWKKSHKIEELAKTDLPSEMLQRFPVRVESHDKNGCIFLESDFGNWNVADYIVNHEFVRDGVKSFLKYCWQVLAKAELAARTAFPKCHQVRVALNVQNFTMDHISEVNSMGALINIFNVYSNYFPNMVNDADFIEVSESFKPMIELMDTYSNDFEFAKVKVHYGNKKEWMSALDAVIEPDQRSPSFGGTA